MAQTNLVGKKILGYTVTEKIDSGAFGTVYKAMKQNTAGQYYRALKHIRIPNEKQYDSVLKSMGGNISKADNYFEMMLTSIVSEIQILNELSENDSRYIVRYYENDIAITPSPKRYDVYILMELLTPLEDYIQQCDEFTVSQVMQLANDILMGIQSCHQRGIMHRDIKEDNIFCAANGNFKIGDFGVSKVLKGSSRADSMKGTPNFLAPEVYLGKAGYTNSVDLYSLGIVLYRLLNYGRNPFLPKYPESYTPADEDQAFGKRMNGEIPELPALGGDAIGRVILKAISPGDVRYQFAGDFYIELNEAIQNTEGDILEKNVKLNPENMADEETACDHGADQHQYDQTRVESLGTIPIFTDTFVNIDAEEGEIRTNKDLFNSISETGIQRTVFPIPQKEERAADQQTAEPDQPVHGEEEFTDQEEYDDLTTRSVTPEPPAVEAGVIQSRNDDRKNQISVYFYPVILLVIAFIAYPIIGITSVFMPIFVLGWFAAFIASLFMVGKHLQQPKQTISSNAALKGKEPYLLAMDASSALNQISQSTYHPDLDSLKRSLKKLEEKLSADTDFGSGNPDIINCENNIAKQLQYIVETIPEFQRKKKSAAMNLNSAISNVNSLLRTRAELKKK